MDFKQFLFLILNIVSVSKVNGTMFLFPILNSTARRAQMPGVMVKVDDIDKTRAEIEDHPYAVQIHQYKNEINPDNGCVLGYQFICTGALLAPQIIITAAKCVYVDNYYGVNAGVVCTNEFTNWRTVVNKRIHPLFALGNFDFNVALIKVERPFDLSTKITPICLSTYDWEYKREFEDVSGTIVGWAQTRPFQDPQDATELQQDTYRIIKKEECDSQLSWMESNEKPAPELCASFCLEKPAYGPKPRVCISQIGALFVKNRRLFGIASYLQFNCKWSYVNSKIAYIYAKLTHYGLRHWINATMVQLSTTKPDILVKRLKLLRNHKLQVCRR